MKAKADGNLRRIFHDKLLPWHWTPIETITVNGVPDAECCWKGVQFWIEYKFTSGFAVGLRPQQIGWLLRRSRAGGRCFVGVRRTTLSTTRAPAVDQLYIFRGGDAGELGEHGLGPFGPAPLGRWEGGPSEWNWNEVSEVLTGRLGAPGAPPPR